MGNRQWNQFQATSLKGQVSLYPVVAVAAAGAVTLKKRQYSAVGTNNSPAYSLGNAATSGVGYAVGDGQGVRSVVRNSAGNWTITLSDPYLYLVAVRLAQLSSATAAATITTVGVVSGSTNVTTNTATGNGGVVRVIFNDSAGAATDPGDGDTVTLEIVLGNSSAL